MVATSLWLRQIGGSLVNPLNFFFFWFDNWLQVLWNTQLFYGSFSNVILHLNCCLRISTLLSVEEFYDLWGSDWNVSSWCKCTFNVSSPTAVFPKRISKDASQQICIPLSPLSKPPNTSESSSVLSADKIPIKVSGRRRSSTQSWNEATVLTRNTHTFD